MDVQPPSHPVPIAAVVPNSPAFIAGIQTGWELLTVNGVPIPDILAYRRELAGGRARLVVQDPESGGLVPFTVAWEDPGLEFSEVVFDGLRLCANKCEFCYIHQMPQGFRKSLYVMDDDFRTSFLYGSFITLTNLSEHDIARILDENLSPLYVSVHTTDEDLRHDMMKWWRLKVINPQATKIRDMLDRLAPIELYTQLVLLPGRNDGRALDETLNHLASRPNIQAVAAVPVGLTEHRRNLPELRPYATGEAMAIVKRMHRFQRRMLAERGSRFVFLSDEFYLLAGHPVPSEKAYEGFPMLENGVGMVRDFLATPMGSLPAALEEPKRVILASGSLFAPVLSSAVAPLSDLDGLDIEVRALENRTFGSVTTVAGLLAGGDILDQIEPGEADQLILSPNVVKYGTEMLLDGLSLGDLRDRLDMNVDLGGTSLAELVHVVIYGSRATAAPQFGFSTHAVKESAKQH